MSFFTFLTAVFLIFIAGFVFMVAMLFTAEYMFYRAKQMQLEMLADLEKDFDESMNEVPDLFDTRDIG